MNGVCSRYVENGSPKERSAVRRACPIMVTVCSGSFSEALWVMVGYIAVQVSQQNMCFRDWRMVLGRVYTFLL